MSAVQFNNKRYRLKACYLTININIYLIIFRTTGRMSDVVKPYIICTGDYQMIDRPIVSVGQYYLTNYK